VERTANSFLPILASHRDIRHRPRGTFS
jgi:hypothetical protein